MNQVPTKKTRGRTGCLTCRIRRIKCDEDRPLCRRCISTGRRCDGYEVNPATRTTAIKQNGKRPLRPFRAGSNNNTSLLPKSLLPTSQISAIEAQGLTYFRQHTAHDIPGCFDSTIWNQLVLQLSHGEPCIRHAVVAVGVMHQFTGGNCPSLNISNNYLGPGSPFAIKQYIKSLCYLRERLDGPKDSVCEQVALVTCLLFICLEMLQGNRPSALAHLQTGLRVLAGSHTPFLQVNRHQEAIRFDFTRSRKTSALPQLASIFARLDYESTMFGQQSPALTFVPTDDGTYTGLGIPDRFASIDDARQSLDKLANAVLGLRGTVLHLASQTTAKNPDGDWVHNLCAHHARARTIDLSHHEHISRQGSTVQASLEQWNTAFKLLVRTPTYSHSQPAIILELQHFYLYFLISTSRTTHERESDRFSRTFQRVIYLAEKFIARSGDAARTSTFTLESGVIPSLYLVAMKCRDPRTREKAISLLRQTPCQEGMWEGALIAKFATEMANLEERAFGVRESWRDPVTANDVPEKARFCDVVVAMSGIAGHGRLVCARYLHESTGDLQVVERTFLL